MRRDGIPYVQNPRNYYPPVDISKLTLDELKKKYLKLCGKSNGDVSVCSKCQTPCSEGKRAIQLLANEVCDAKVPLYGGKTLIERAKEENAARRAAEEAKKIEESLVSYTEPKENKAESKENKKPKRIRLEVNDWWEASVAYGDQVEYLMKTYGVTKTQAKSKIWHGKKMKGEIKVEMPVLKSEPEELPKEEPVQKEPVHESHSNDIAIRTFELMIGDMMKKQDEYKVQMEKYTKLYNEITAQINVLCEAVDIANKNANT